MQNICFRLLPFHLVISSSLFTITLSNYCGHQAMAPLIREVECEKKEVANSTVSNNEKVATLGSVSDDKNGKVAGYIQHGNAAVMHSWPWVVALVDLLGHSCGGTLISDRWVLTAAHCLFEEGTTLAILSPEARIPHPDYNKATFENDIAVIELNETVVLGDAKNLACVPSLHINGKEESKGNPECVVAGWGYTKLFGKSKSKFLRQATLPLLDVHTCKQIWKSFKNTTVSTKTNLCTQHDCKGLCGGDSGGGLYCHVAGHWTVIGVVSFGLTNCSTRMPDILTRVAAYRHWIETSCRGCLDNVIPHRWRNTTVDDILAGYRNSKTLVLVDYLERELVRLNNYVSPSAPLCKKRTHKAIDEIRKVLHVCWQKKYELCFEAVAAHQTQSLVEIIRETKNADGNNNSCLLHLYEFMWTSTRPGSKPKETSCKMIRLIVNYGDKEISRIMFDHDIVLEVYEECSTLQIMLHEYRKKAADPAVHGVWCAEQIIKQNTGPGQLEEQLKMCLGVIFGKNLTRLVKGIWNYTAPVKCRAALENFLIFAKSYPAESCHRLGISACFETNETRLEHFLRLQSPNDLLCIENFFEQFDSIGRVMLEFYCRLFLLFNMNKACRSIVVAISIENKKSKQSTRCHSRKLRQTLEEKSQDWHYANCFLEVLVVEVNLKQGYIGTGQCKKILRRIHGDGNLCEQISSSVT